MEPALKKNNEVSLFPASDAMWERSVKVIPAGTQTLSKGPDQFVRGVTPKYLCRGKGAHVWDLDGNEYIDYPLALGPILLGYDYAPVSEAVIRQVREGTTFTLMHPLEVEVAELMRSIIPCAEMVRFGKNGADATSAAVKVARASTGRDHIAYCGYHGCQDWYAIVTPRNKGIPRNLADYMHKFEYNQIETLERVFAENPGKIGCVIMEVPGTDPLVDPETGRNFLQLAKEIANKNGALFVLDEIVTGFRYSLGGAGKYYGVVPDLACFGKGMANGFPISAIAGKREFMKELNEVFFSMTYSGDAIGLSAAKATINELMTKPVIERIWEAGKRLHDGINGFAKEIGADFSITGKPPRGGISARNSGGEEDLLLKSIFLQETVKRGVLYGGPVFISYSHTDEDIAKTIEASREALSVLKKAVESGNPAGFLVGEPIGVVFRQRN
ncbi:MAG: aminotransferase class III-fold pyridoxal phosphate-dependent enzyme [Deltaproteobacteria bacterium]|nr:aminotransferase class III-fold pyridoxal phosphate-dependent enzyme [Deltaproteobacteria bacterium]MBZ0219243.1 aminotransferase class III-fold pyridoxal phosphate-dependent enzyme [Deltaproteobacteria bacterium]